MAIAYSTSAEGEHTTSVSQAVDAGSATGNRFMVITASVYHGGGSQGSIDSVTYAGVSATNVNSSERQNGGVYGIKIYNWVLVNPATGSNTLAISGTNSDNIFWNVQVYTGVNQSTTVDATGSNNGSNNSMTTNITTVADNCWLVGGILQAGAPPTFTAGTATTIRQQEISGYSGGWGCFDSNGAKTPAGAYSLIVTSNKSDNWVTAIISLKEPASGPANVKTYNTNPITNIKTIDTNPIANVKSLNTNT